MDSLRSRPSQAPRKGKSPAKLSKGGGDPIPRPRTTRVDDKIKKRMSMRYAEISSPIDSGSIPAMPSLAGFLPGGQPSGGVLYDEPDDATRQQDAARIAAEDKRILSSDDFDPDAFLKRKLANSTEAELRSLQSSLEKAKEDTASDLQRSVFKNYAEFVLISKEISVLENEMLELKELLSDYKSMPQMLHIPDPTSVTSSTLSTYKRSSVADLRVLYSNQMHALHTSIEGAAKFVPTTPGRHVVGEFENILSLNAATYKIIHKVKFVVLDDAVLVARRRRRNAGGGDAAGTTVNEGKLVAEKCWALNEMIVLDTKDSSSMTNVFKVRNGKETHVYRTETAQEKKSILTLFRQVAEELQTKRRKEREGEHERRKSMWQGNAAGGRNSPVPPLPEWMADLARRGGDIPNVAADAKAKAERDARWVGDWSDNLTVAIALKEWNKAVQLVEEGQARAATMPPLAARLPALTQQLTQSLLESLSLPSNRKSSTVNLISLLNRLKAGSAARTTFLEMRGKVIHSLMRKIPFEGHVGTYIGELAVVFFTGIKHTADWYLASFKENEVASSFITWAKQQIEKYGEIFRKQVYSKDVEPQIVEESVQITLNQSRKLLEEYGLDFKFLLNSILVENPKQPSSATVEFKVNEHRQSKQIAQITKQNSRSDLRPKKSSSQLNTPAPPTLAPAPPGRRKSPAPPPISMKNSMGSIPPALSSASLQPPNSAASSSYSGIQTAQDVSGLGSSRMYRSRTPVSAAQTPTHENPPASASNPKDGPVSPTPMRQANSSGSGSYLRERPERERPPRSLRASPVPRSGASGTGSPAPVPPPPRSVHRPGSSVGRPPPREGMF